MDQNGSNSPVEKPLLLKNDRKDLNLSGLVLNVGNFVSLLVYTSFRQWNILHMCLTNVSIPSVQIYTWGRTTSSSKGQKGPLSILT